MQLISGPAAAPQRPTRAKDNLWKPNFLRPQNDKSALSFFVPAIPDLLSISYVSFPIILNKEDQFNKTTHQ